jgi:hypothetical protein
MNQNTLKHSRGRGLLIAAICVTLAPTCLAVQPSPGVNQLTAQAPISKSDKQAIAVFERRVKDYVKLRNQVKGKVPKLSKDSTPEQIQAFKTSFEMAMRSARAGAKRGALFTPQAANYIDRMLQLEFKGKDRLQLREIVFEAETAGVPLRVNYPYPASAELTEMPPTLLLKLPQLPKELRYRFVGRSLLLVDRDNNLIIDYMVGALP